MADNLDELSSEQNLEKMRSEISTLRDALFSLTKRVVSLEEREMGLIDAIRSVCHRAFGCGFIFRFKSWGGTLCSVDASTDAPRWIEARTPVFEFSDSQKDPSALAGSLKDGQESFDEDPKPAAEPGDIS